MGVGRCVHETYSQKNGITQLAVKINGLILLSQSEKNKRHTSTGGIPERYKRTYPCNTLTDAERTVKRLGRGRVSRANCIQRTVEGAGATSSILGDKPQRRVESGRIRRVGIDRDHFVVQKLTLTLLGHYTSTPFLNAKKVNRFLWYKRVYRKK